MKAVSFAAALALPLLSACASIPQHPSPSLASPALRALKLHVAQASGGVGSGSLAKAMPAALNDALRAYGLQSVADAGEADAVLQTKIDSVSTTLQPFHTTLVLNSYGVGVETLEFTGGAIGNNGNSNAKTFGAIAQSVAHNLIAKLVSSPRLAALARNPRQYAPAFQAPAASAAPAAAGLTAADIERIARAVRGTEASAPAPAAAAAGIAPRFTSPERPDDLAVIVGVESYSDIATKAPYAERDADAFKSFVRALGVPERNIVLLKGPKAVKSSLEKNLEGWLPRLAKPESRVYFYFSGHGAPEIKTGQAYLVPWDGDPNFLEATAYPVSRLYEKLGALPAKQVLVAMDSCFSGAGGRSVLASGARPLVGKVETGAVPAKVTVLAASAASEISGSLDDRRHGAFTYFLLEGLNAGRTGAKALHAYLVPKVQDEARRLNRDQTPQLLGADLTLR